MRKPEDAGAPIVVVLPGAARPMDNYSKISEALARSGYFVIVMEQLVDVMVPDDPRIHFSNFTDVNLIPASVIPLALRWIADEYASGSAQILPCETPNQDSVALLGHALGARAVRPPSLQPCDVDGQASRKTQEHPAIHDSIVSGLHTLLLIAVYTFHMPFKCQPMSQVLILGTGSCTFLQTSVCRQKCAHCNVAQHLYTTSLPQMC